jgi:hypothetical protein
MELRGTDCADANRVDLDQNRPEWWVGSGDDGSEMQYSVNRELLDKVNSYNLTSKSLSLNIIIKIL